MQITLNQDEIHAAVDLYVRSQINISENQELSIDFTAGRGPNGLSATLDIKPKALAKVAAKPAFRNVIQTTVAPAAALTVVAEEADEAPAEAEEEQPVEPEAADASDETADEVQDEAPKASAPRVSIFSAGK